MYLPLLSSVHRFLSHISDPHERLKQFCPLTLTPWDIARLLEKLQGLYDPPRTPMPADTVLIGSQVQLVDVLDGSDFDITITLPEDSDPARGLISVLSPLGAAALGLKQGENFCVLVGNRMARFRIDAIH